MLWQALLPFSFSVFGVLHDPKDEDSLGAIVHSCDQKVFVSADVEDRAAADLISGSKIGPKRGEVQPFGLPGHCEPVRQRRHRIGMELPKFACCLPADHSHLVSVYNL